MLIAGSWVAGDVGLGTYTDERVRDPRSPALAGKMRYRVDPEDPYPEVLPGHMRVPLVDGHSIEERQSHLRGGTHEPMTRQEPTHKFRGNCALGGSSATSAARLLDFGGQVFEGAPDPRTARCWRVPALDFRLAHSSRTVRKVNCATSVRLD